MDYPMNQMPYLIFFLYPPAIQENASEFTLPFNANSHFQKTSAEGNENKQVKKLQEKKQNQDNLGVNYQANSKRPSNFSRKKKNNIKTLDYNPRQRKRKPKNKTIYEKDKQRNILPNALSKLFFFLKSMTKSETLIKKVLLANKALNLHLTEFKYYTYMNLIKSKLSRSLSEESISILFNINDPQCSIFSEVQQLCLIKTIAIMSRIFIKNRMYLPLIINSSQIPREKIPSYIKKYRTIQTRMQESMERAQEKFNFDLIKQSPQG